MHCHEAGSACLVAWHGLEAAPVLPRGLPVSNCHSREGGNPVSFAKRHWVPAYAGTTN